LVFHLLIEKIKDILDGCFLVGISDTIEQTIRNSELLWRVKLLAKKIDQSRNWSQRVLVGWRLYLDLHEDIVQDESKEGLKAGESMIDTVSDSPIA
jgi:hypothetical protein